MLYQGEQAVLPLAQQYLIPSALDIVSLTSDDYMPMLRRAHHVAACLFRFTVSTWNEQKSIITHDLAPFTDASHAYIMLRTSTHTQSSSFQPVMPYLNHISAPFLHADITWGFSQFEQLNEDNAIEIFILLLRVRPSIFRTADELIAPYIHHHSTPPVGYWRIYGRFCGLLFTVGEYDADEEPAVPLRQLICDFSAAMNLQTSCEDDSPKKRYLDRLEALRSQLATRSEVPMSNEQQAAECTMGFLEAYTIAHTSQNYDLLLRLKNISPQKCPYTRREIYDAFLQMHKEMSLEITRIAVPYNGHYAERCTIEDAIADLLSVSPASDISERNQRITTLHQHIRRMILYNCDYRTTFCKCGLSALLDYICSHTHITENDTCYNLIATAMQPLLPSHDIGNYLISCRRADQILSVGDTSYTDLQDLISKATYPYPDDAQHIYLERILLNPASATQPLADDDFTPLPTSAQEPQYAYNIFFSDKPFPPDFQERINCDIPLQDTSCSRLSEHIPSCYLPMLYAHNDYVLIADHYQAESATQIGA
ncbi:MAG TPA: hypothetical protein DIW30_08735 [Bacteroidales bacterium]|nr:hypothetical protein [Bacteroidales bacterium]